MDLEEEKRNRRRRINRLKKMILTVVALAILIPTVLSIVFGVQLHKARRLQDKLRTTNDILVKDINNLELQVEYYKQQQIAEPATGCFVTNSDEGSDTDESSRADGHDTDLENASPEEIMRKVYLTFDDGPSIYTNEILDILKEYNIKATFFVVGKEDAQYDEVYKRIVDEGHTLGMHSYSHKYNEIYASEKAFLDDIDKLQSFLEEKTGQKCIFSRFPGGSSNTVSSVDMNILISDLAKRGITYFDWNVSSGDAVAGYISSKQIVSNCTDSLSSYQTAVMLMHDSAERKTTVEALPELIETIEAMENTVLLPITEDTKLVQHIKNESEE